MEHLKDVLDQIDYLLHDANVGEPDLRLLRQLLNVMKSNIKIGIFETVLEENTDIKDVMQKIETKVEEYTREKNELENRLASQAINKGSKRLERLNKTINFLMQVYNSINNNNMRTLISSYASDIENGKDLVDDCTVSLAVGYNEFQNYFGKPIAMSTTGGLSSYTVDYETIDKIFAVICNASLKSTLTDYSRKRTKLEKDEKILAFNMGKRELYELLQSVNSNDVKKYIAARTGEITNDAEMTRNTVAKQELEIKLTEFDGIQKFLNYGKYKDMVSAIEERKKNIKNASSRRGNCRKTIEELDKKYKDTNLRSLIDAVIGRFQIIDNDEHYDFRSIYNYDAARDDYHEAVVDVIISLYKSKSFDNPKVFAEKVEALIEQTSKTINELDERVEQERTSVDTIYNGLEGEAKSLVDNDYQTVKQIVDLQTAKSRYHRTPIICAYILKALSDTQKISWEDLNNMINSMSEEEIQEKITEYNEIISKYAQNNEKKLDSIVEEYEQTTTPRF